MKEIELIKCCEMELAVKDEKRYIRIMKALGNPHRFEIIKFLWTHSGCVTGDIVESLPINQSTTSQHLKVLKEAGLVDVKQRKTSSVYCLNEEAIIWLRDMTNTIFQT